MRKQQLNEAEHIRSMIEVISDRNLPGPGDFDPPEYGPDPMPKVEEALGDLVLLKQNLRSVVQTYKEDKTKSVEMLNELLLKTENYFSNEAWNAFDEGGDTKKHRELEDRFNEFALSEEDGEVTKINDAGQMKNIVNQLKKIFNEVESELEYFLDY